MATGMIKEDDQIYMYCLAYNTGHADTQRKAAVGRISFRKDRFISQNAADEGVYTTIPIKIENNCNCIRVNLETSEDGFMRCELLKASGEVIAGMNIENSAVITGNHSSVKMSWEGIDNLKSLQGQDIRIRFIGKAVKLYSFELSPC